MRLDDRFDVEPPCTQRPRDRLEVLRRLLLVGRHVLVREAADHRAPRRHQHERRHHDLQQRVLGAAQPADRLRRAQRRLGQLRAVQRDQDAPELARLLRNAPLAGPQQQHRHVHLPDQRVRDAPEPRAGESAAPVRGHDDEADLLLLGVARQRRRDRAFQQRATHHHARRLRTAIGQARQVLLLAPPRLLLELAVVGRQALHVRRGTHRLVYVHQVHFRPHPPRQVEPHRKRLLAER